jgi:hypothetical protein
VDFQNLVSREPTGEIEVMRRGVVEEGSICFHLTGSGGGGLLVAADGLEYDDVPDFAGFDSPAGGDVRRIVPSHVPDLEDDAGALHRRERCVGVLEG